MKTKQHYAKPILFILCLMPLATLVWRGFAGNLGANPVETITHETGEWALRFLLITLLISPAISWTGNATIIRFRRMFGLYVFFYAFCHFMIWLIADHSLSISDMLEDIIDRPYISFGFSAFLALIPLAATSNQAMIRRLGKRWKSLHKLTYLVAVLVVLHIIWLVKADYFEAGIYAGLIIGLLLLRVKNRAGKSGRT
ncbi:MAG: sulfoxide reductase heme-binding subunit YedZ, partial [Gammaproteobacteria bacterium]|nr:sulfoxide reductase heme-binding subunit YedZ [Gammaproteobacteria bacterium]